jgi:uncharacterized protein involved in type VI secretion and phage assembly
VGIQGLHTGLVTQVAEDPAGDYRVRVSVPSVGAAESVWARLACFYASNAVGAVFYPEVGDEVVLGFMNDDPRNPIILGSLYGPTRAPAYPPDKENHKKAIVTRAKLEMTYDDKDKIIEIKTPGGHSIQLNDKTGEIKIRDGNSNSVTLGKSGITIDSASQIEMKAKTNISIKAGGNLDMEATGMAELKTAGTLTIKGALVEIN